MNTRPQGAPSGRIGRVVVINDVSVVRGGATAIALTSARMMRDRGIPVTFVTGDRGDALTPADRGIVFEALQGRHILEGPRAGAALRGLYNADAARALARFIARTDTPDTVYHLHGWSKVLSPSVFRALAPVASRLVVAAHDFFLVCPNGGSFDFRREAVCDLRPMGAGCLVTNCDRRHAAHKLWRVVRQGVRRALIDFGTTEALVLAVHEGMIPILDRGGIARSRSRALRNPVMPWRAERVAAEANRSILFVGRLEQDKGVDLLARAARRANVPLRVVGAGPLGAQLAAEHPEVEQLGWRDRTQIGALVAQARCLVMPTRYREAFGIVALEGLMSGLPVVLPDHAMLAPEIRDGGFGLTCDPHDEAALAATLRRLADDDEAVAAMSRRGHAHARELAPTPDAWIDALLDLYSERFEARPAPLSPEHGHYPSDALTVDTLRIQQDVVAPTAAALTHVHTDGNARTFQL
ncbi:glycosyltransferase family 4 protein [Methylobacterium trifolii]|uniref:D-inositol-3-phosphate glycosyltransferase n=1 Tax=Methylobacterium trifolii TaxID=1003092 RepID=A0ABQ4U610_9HYPH|nr:glycosyltransferase family 4 protein [Methylobacterium trifolii]GJE62604.1 D-inositol-3-phosphate glycosyltransferase [Methylobacterium trifolii]